ncbi:MAG: DUF3526 domain-containing protein [Arcicella sp.]|jgi:ABC-2 type transport system permease protein|nr:DUF3526 domain-containing protein [Arcicella sp.]
MTRLLLLNFIRSKGVLWGLGLLFFTGLLGINTGKQFLNKYQENVTQTAYNQQESIKRNVKYHPKEIGLLLYYVKFGLVNEMPNLAALSIGQRDVNPSVQNVTIRFLEEQKYNTDLLNPLYSLLGNLDFSFVLIYFFPLIIIAFCYSLLSEEREGGTWSLVLSQSANPKKLLRIKILIRFSSILLVLLLLFLVAKFYLNIAFDVPFLAFMVVSILYLIFWFSLGWFVISFQQSSSQNAIVLLLAWVILTVISPAISTAFVNAKLPVSETFQTVLDSRDGYHKKWDLPKEVTVQKFFKHYPQFAKFKMPEGDFNWLWYYAMQQMGDDEASNASKQLQLKLRQRENLSSTLSMIFPSIHTALTMNDLAKTGLGNQLSFGEQLVKFHEQKRLYFYPKIFSEAPVLKENWNIFPLEYYQEKKAVNWLKLLLPLVILSSLCGFWGEIRLKRL